MSLVDGVLTLSSLYDWYRSDFGTTPKKIKEHLQRYADEELSRRLKNHRGEISYTYDWALNGAADGDD